MGDNGSGSIGAVFETAVCGCHLGHNVDHDVFLTFLSERRRVRAAKFDRRLIKIDAGQAFWMAILIYSQIALTLKLSKKPLYVQNPIHHAKSVTLG